MACVLPVALVPSNSMGTGVGGEGISLGGGQLKFGRLVHHGNDVVHLTFVESEQRVALTTGVQDRLTRDVAVRVAEIDGVVIGIGVAVRERRRAR